MIAVMLVTLAEHVAEPVVAVAHRGWQLRRHRRRGAPHAASSWSCRERRVDRAERAVPACDLVARASSPARRRARPTPGRRGAARRASPPRRRRGPAPSAQHVVGERRGEDRLEALALAGGSSRGTAASRAARRRPRRTRWARARRRRAVERAHRARAWRATSRLRTGSSPGGATFNTTRRLRRGGPPVDRGGVREARRPAGERLRRRRPCIPGAHDCAGARRARRQVVEVELGRPPSVTPTSVGPVASRRVGSADATVPVRRRRSCSCTGSCSRCSTSRPS